MIMGERFEFLGAHVTPAVKDTVRATAASRKESMSKFISDSLEERLANLGIKIEEDIHNDPKLPFDVVHEFTCQTNPGSKGYVPNSSCNCRAEDGRFDANDRCEE